MTRASGAGKALGPAMLTALVVGNMVGSGVFLLPASLAPFGGVSVLGWVVTAAGSACIGLVLARLARRRPEAGGPYAYTRAAFGELAGFLVGWGYWISCWCAQAAIAVAMVGYLAKLAPALESPAAGGAAAIGAIALLCAVNVRGVREAGGVQLVTTVLKALPLLAIAAFGLARFDPGLLEPFNPTGEPLARAVRGCLALTLWAFLGFESASVAAEDAEDARRDVPRATLVGIALVAALYLASTLAVQGLVPRETLARSSAPFADAAQILWGERAGRLVALGAAVSCFGALNGWTLVAGRLPLAMARDRLFPAAFARAPRGTPALALVVSSALAVGLVLAARSGHGTLVGMFDEMILLATLSTLVPFVFCAMAEILLRARDAAPGAPAARWATPVALSAFAYSLVAIEGAGDEAVARGFLLLLAGIPLYVLARRRS